MPRPPRLANRSGPSPRLSDPRILNPFISASCASTLHVTRVRSSVCANWRGGGRYVARIGQNQTGRRHACQRQYGRARDFRYTLAVLSPLTP